MARILLGNDTYDAVAAKAGVPGGQGHKYYEDWRVLDPKSPEAQAIAEKSRAYYDAVRKGTLTLENSILPTLAGYSFGTPVWICRDNTWTLCALDNKYIGCLISYTNTEINVSSSNALKLDYWESLSISP